MRRNNMYGIINNLDWSFLIGKELLQICISLYQLSLRFNGDVSINIECEFEHVSLAANSLPAAKLSGTAVTLVSLLGARITAVSKQGVKTLGIEFSNGEMLMIHDSNDSYESFSINAPGKEIVI
jgi:hypothetical protein